MRTHAGRVVWGTADSEPVDAYARNLPSIVGEREQSRLKSSGDRAQSASTTSTATRADRRGDRGIPAQGGDSCNCEYRGSGEGETSTGVSGDDDNDVEGV